MKRQLCATALFGLALIPDWAGACWPPGGGPPQPTFYVPAYCYTPTHHAPIYYAVPEYVPAAPRPAAPPRVEPMKNKGGALVEPVRPIAQPNPAPTKPPQVEQVRPAAGSDATKPPAAGPEPAPAPAPVEPKRGGPIDVPRPAAEPKLPPLELPKGPEPKLPPLELPKADGAMPAPPVGAPTGPDAAPKLPPLELPKTDAPKLPELPGGPAVPSAAPAPDALIPPPGIPSKAPDALPPLTLPPDTPVAPDKPVEVKSSPLTGTGREWKVSVFPAAGTGAAPGLRKVGFYNHTARDLSLTIEGRAVTLPAMSYVHAQVPAAFTWKCGNRPATKETVPADATGVDVLIRE